MRLYRSARVAPEKRSIPKPLAGLNFEILGNWHQEVVLSEFDQRQTLETLLDSLEHAAKALFPPDVWNDVSDEQIINAMCQQTGEMSGEFVKDLARKICSEWFPESDEH